MAAQMKRADRTPPCGAFLAMIRPDLADSSVRYRCTACGRRRIRRAFGDNKQRPDGRAVQCRQCKREQSRKDRARARRQWQKLVRRFGTVIIDGKGPPIVISAGNVPHGNPTLRHKRGRRFTTTRGQKA